MATILVLEDKSKTGLLNISDILVVNDFDVVPANSPQEMSGKAGTGSIDAVVIDVGQLGDRAAYDVVAELYRTEGFKPVPVLFVIEEGESVSTSLHGLPFNQVETLSKPFDMDGLLDRVRVLLQKGKVFERSLFAANATSPPAPARAPQPPPRTAPFEAPEAAAGESAGPSRTSASQPPTILIVEDTFAIRRVLKKYVETAGYQSLEAEDGVEAISRVTNNKVDLVLLDVMLPKLDGFSVLEILKSDPRHRKIPVIMCTAKNAKEDVIRGKKLGADGYIVKPFNAETLRAKILQLLENRGA